MKRSRNVFGELVVSWHPVACVVVGAGLVVAAAWVLFGAAWVALLVGVVLVAYGLTVDLGVR